MILSCSSLEVVAIQSSNWSFVVFSGDLLFFVCFFNGDGFLPCSLLPLVVFVAVAVDCAVAVEAVDGTLEIFGDVDSPPLLSLPVGSPIKEETADRKESSFAVLFLMFFGGECFLAFPFVTS